MKGDVLTQQTAYAAVTHGGPGWLVIDRINNGLAFGGFSTSYQLEQGNAWQPGPLWEKIENDIQTAVIKATDRSLAPCLPMREAYKSLYGSVLSP